MRKKVTQKNKEDLFSQGKKYKQIDLRNFEVEPKPVFRKDDLSEKLIYDQNSYDEF